MKFVYFTKMLQGLDVEKLIAFFKEVGLDGADLAVRPGNPVNPANAAVELPKASAAFKAAGLTIGLISAPTDLNDPTSADAKTLFESAGKSGVPAIKLGYFTWKANFDDALTVARRRLKGFEELARKTGVRAVYHTHSGAYLGNNAAGLRLLLTDLDPHHVGAFVDTGHLAINGGPIRMELDIVKSWVSLVAIKDMMWTTQGGWKSHVVPAGTGMVKWDDVASALKDLRFNGTVSLHGEYETADFAERTALAKKELALLKAKFV